MKAILVVSFGTTHEDTRVKNIEKLEDGIAKTSGRKVYRAWTSRMIIERIRERDGVKIDTVREAMDRMKDGGVTDLIVVPTHIINGVEYHQMLRDMEEYRPYFHSLKVTSPLLTEDSDYERVCTILCAEFQDYFRSNGLSQEEFAIVLMGHGSEHFSNSAYAALDYRFKDMGQEHVFVGTVEAYPDVETVLKHVKHSKYRKVLLTPFMLVAGDHAKNDMAGDEEESWKSVFEKEGYEVHCLVKGLGEYAPVREMFAKRVREAMQEE